MVQFIAKRLIQIPLIMFILSVLVIGMTQFLTPEQRAAPYIRTDQQAARMEVIIRERGLDQPFHVQYAKWFGDIVKGDLGFSRASSQDVAATIKERLPATIQLALFAIIPMIIISVWLGVLSALNKDNLIDQVLRVLVTISYSIPTFVLGIILLAVFYGYLGLLPGSGAVSNALKFDVLTMQRPTGMMVIDALLAGKWNIFWDAIKHLILPAITLTVVISASLIKVMRNNMLEVLNSDFVRTAWAKGLGSRVVHNKHARRNALLPMVTLGSFVIINLLGGAVITETIFAYPGIGLWFIQSAMQLDIAGVMGFTLLSAVIVVVVNTLVDILYGVVDPRVRFD